MAHCWLTVSLATPGPPGASLQSCFLYVTSPVATVTQRSLRVASQRQHHLTQYLWMYHIKARGFLYFQSAQVFFNLILFYQGDQLQQISHAGIISGCIHNMYLCTDQKPNHRLQKTPKFKTKPNQKQKWCFNPKNESQPSAAILFFKVLPFRQQNGL